MTYYVVVVVVVVVTAYIILAIRADISCPKGKAIEISGAGSQFPADYYKDVVAAYATNRSSLGISIKFTYDSVSSGYGKDKIMRLIGDKPVVFAASETLLPESDDYVDAKRGLKTFPVIAGAVTMIVNIPGVNVSDLVMRFVDLPRIYMGEIDFWDNVALAAVNPGLRLPHKRILPVAYAGSTGLTEAFTNSLSSINRNWDATYGTFVVPEFTNGDCCNSTNWPPAVAYFANRVTAMIGIVTSIPYTIGYVAVAQSQQYPQYTLNLLGYNDTLLPPTQTSVQKAMDYYYQRSRGSLTYFITNAPDAYPMASFSYAIINSTTTQGITCCQMREVIGLLEYALLDQTDNVAAKYGLAKLSSTMTMEVQRILQGFTCNDESVYDAYKESQYVPTQIGAGIIGGISAAVVVVVLGILGATGYLVVMRKLADESNWLIDGTRLNPIDEEMNSNEERASPVSSASEIGNSLSMRVHPLKYPQSRARLDEKIVVLSTMVGMPHPWRWNSQTKRLVTRLKAQLSHDHIAVLIGATTHNDHVYMLTIAAKKGSLHYVLQTCPYELDLVTKYSFATDIADAMEYLHSKGVIHGLLSSLTCYVEGSWSIKVGHWCRLTVMESQSRSIFMDTVNHTVSSSEFLLRGRLIEGLYIDPDILLTGSTKKPNDIYSFGLLLVEIFTQKLPYQENVSGRMEHAETFQEVLMSKTQKHGHSALIVPEDIQSELKLTIDSCLREPLTSRPTFTALLTELKKQNTSPLGIVDVMMEALENHVKQLEATTNELNRATKRIQDLLNEVLPPIIARKLANDERVEPEHFDCVTVFFSDIVSFTTMSAQLTALEVMHLLNELWTAFDKIIDLYDVYKVDTIGDAYMVCSGLPEPNGTEHVKEISRMALALLDAATTFSIPNRPDKIRIRVGFNSGPVTTGVVGTKLPQYCVFGDTVNTASRMESTSVPLRCQMSESSYELLKDHYPQFHTELRGSIEVKGKGVMKTYWLLSEDQQQPTSILTKTSRVRRETYN